MGSFNLACGISNTSVSPGERVGVVLISPNKLLEFEHEHPGKFYGPALVHSNTLYKPVFPAIYAKYDDYGQFTDIEPSPITKLLESLLEAPISDILNEVGADWEKELTPQLKALQTTSFFLYRPDVFDGLKNFMQSRGHIFDNIRLGDDKSWEVFQGSLVLDQYGFPNPSRVRQNPINEFIEGETNFPVDGSLVVELGVDDMKQSILDWYYLVRVMEATNHIFHPTYSGEQHGDWETTQKLAELTQKIVAQREIWDEDDDFDEDEDFDEDDEL
jgi:hypothetical protein